MAIFKSSEDIFVTTDYLDGDSKEYVAKIILNRPDKLNSLSKGLICDFVQILKEVDSDPKCRVVFISGKGKHFCAGADLEWMKDSVSLSQESNFEEAKLLQSLFEVIYELSKPTVSLIRGCVYGGGIGIVSCCDLNIATHSAVFCFSEIKLGLVPAVILPFLGRRVTQGFLKRYCLTGQTFCAQEALHIGLLSQVAKEEELESVVKKNINDLLSAGPQAIKEAKKLNKYLCENSYVSDAVSAKTIARIRVEKEAQEGFSSFFAKKSPSWKRTLSDEWSIHEASN